MEHIQQVPVLMDVDTGVDDALAIMMAVKHEGFNLVGITTVNGNVSLDQATLNTRKVLHAMNTENAHSIPVVTGADKPLKRPHFFEHAVHGKDGLGGALHDLELPPLPPQAVEAAAYIVEQAKLHKGELELIMTAPLTNLALAYELCPELPQLVKRVVVMGGALLTYGNVTPTAEYNIYVDPEAARMVLQAGFDLTLVGLDVTRKALLYERHLQELDRAPLGPLVRQCMQDYMVRYEQKNGVAACALHDPLAVGVAIDPTLVETKLLHVDVETASKLCDGQTVCDIQNRLGQQPNVKVCLNVDSERFLQLFQELIQK